jgi:hypothetical protein
MSDRRSHVAHSLVVPSLAVQGDAVRETVHDADQFVRCAICWRWFDRSNPLALAGHRGPLPHAVAARCTAWADEDE